MLNSCNTTVFTLQKPTLNKTYDNKLPLHVIFALSNLSKPAKMIAYSSNSETCRKAPERRKLLNFDQFQIESKRGQRAILILMNNN